MEMNKNEQPFGWATTTLHHNKTHDNNSNQNKLIHKMDVASCDTINHGQNNIGEVIALRCQLTYNIT